jgi:hypothetical protein
MTAQEIHIDLDYHIQKINSNATRNIEAKEKDWLFNEEVDKFLSSKTRPSSDLKGIGFEGDTKRLEDIKPLIKTKKLEVESINDKVGKVILPTFSYKPIRVDCDFFKKCDKSVYKEENKTKVVKSFKFPDANKNYKITVFIGNRSKILFDSTLLPSNYIKGNMFYLIKAFIITVRNAFENDSFYKDNLEFYYQWYGDTFKADTFFFKGNVEFANLKVEISDTISIEQNPLLREQPPTIVSSQNVKYETYSSRLHITSTARLSNEEIEINKLNSFLSTSLQESPLINIEKNVCFVHYPKNTIIKSVDFVYIEECQKIDLLLNQSLKLERNVIQEIVMNTARFIKALFDENNYDKYLKETTLIE